MSKYNRGDKVAVWGTVEHSGSDYVHVSFGPASSAHITVDAVAKHIPKIVDFDVGDRITWHGCWNSDGYEVAAKDQEWVVIHNPNAIQSFDILQRSNLNNIQIVKKKDA
jgi:hypothetical protein